MPMISWPFDSTVTQDSQGNPIYSRAYSSDVLAALLRKYFRNGVFMAEPTSFQVVEGSGMGVSVQAGHCMINGRHGYNESPQAVALSPADPSLPRVDLIVLRLDLGVNALDIKVAAVTGAPAATPMAPALTRNSSVYEMALAEVRIETGATSIPQSKITDTRLDSERCGVVASIIGDTDTSAYYAQIAADLAEFKAGREANFDAWFTTVQNTLGNDVAGNLLNLINKYKARNATVTLAVADWVAGDGVYTQTKAIGIVPANCTLHASPAWASREAYNDAECGVSAAGEGSVTFTATAVPTAALTVNLSVSEVDA